MEYRVFRCRLWETAGRLPHFWEHTVGSGHAALALRADWRNQLLQCRRELGFQHVRFHAILSDSMGALVREEGKDIYSFHNIDDIFDYLLSIGMKPFVELSFMPEALASGHKTVFHYKANVTPPADYHQWARLVRKLLRHLIDRYGAPEVRTWFFEVWNEPNLKAFWPATQKDYLKLYRVTASAIKEVDTQLQVGGPATANNQWIDEFLQFTRAKHAPVDFVTTHHYPTDALGKAGQNTVEELAKTPRGILRQWAQDTRAKIGNKRLYYTEWSSSSNPHDPLHDEPYCAAVIVKTMMEAVGLAEGYSYWTFTDIFSENYFDSTPFQGGFGLLTIHGIPKPSYRAFQLLHDIGHQRVLVDGVHLTLDCWVVKGRKTAGILLTNYAAPTHPVEEEHVQLQIESRARPTAAYIQRIDEKHANAKAAWLEMGRPQYPDAPQLKRLHAASKLVRRSIGWTYRDKTIYFNLDMPPQSVASITLEFA